MGQLVPTSITEAYENCTNYRSLYGGYSESSEGSTFISHRGRNNRHGGRGSGRNHNREEVKNNRTSEKNDTNNSTASKEDKDNETHSDSAGRCCRCGSTDHYANDCNFSGTCNKCGKQGHKASMCKSKQKKTTAMTKKLCFHNIESDDNHFDKNNFLVHIDNQSNENVFRTRELLLNIRTAAEPVVIAGVAGDEITCHEVGDFLGMEVYYNDMAIANILSWSKVSETMSIEWDQDKNEFRVTTVNGEKLTFECIDGGLYVCDFTHLHLDQLLKSITVIYNNMDI